MTYETISKQLERYNEKVERLRDMIDLHPATCQQQAVILGEFESLVVEFGWIEHDYEALLDTGGQIQSAWAR